jgi:DNA-binding beta-propeller fold protein YncE
MSGVSPLFNGSISSSSFNVPHGATFKNGELFVAQRFGAGALRFLFDGAGNASLNGTITNGLNSGFPRGVTVNPTTGELFVTECCGINEINRYVFDSSGNAIPNGVITGGGLSNPHDLAFSPWGELFVANSDSGNVLRFVFDSSGNATPNGQLSGTDYVLR